MEALLANTSLVLTGSTLLAYLLTLVWEQVRPLLPRDGWHERTRWAGNFGLLLVNHGLPYVLLPLTAAFAARWAEAMGLGLLPALGAPFWLVLPMAFVAVDLLAWVLHWALHRLPWLWRVHQVHHSDLRFDAALAFRFHPIEVALVALGTSAVVITLGLPVEAVLIVSLVGSLHNVFVHANARLGPRAEAAARLLLVTPDLHRVHHSAVVEDSMHNYGIVFSCWDRLLGTWRTPIGGGPQSFGINSERDAARLPLGRLLVMPFQRRR